MNVHDKASKSGKFDFAFMDKGESEKATPKSKQPAGTYPLSEKSNTFAKQDYGPGLGKKG